MRITGRDTRRVWAVTGLLGLAGLLGLVAALLFFRGWDEAARVAGVISIVFAVAPLAVQLMVWSRRGSSSALTVERVTQARELLALRVREQWRREAQARSLGDPEPMPVSWALTEHSVMDHPKLVLTGSGFTGRSDDIHSLVDEFSRLMRRRLVVLGPAGAGKTTLAVQLLLELLDTRTPNEPVPVLLSLAGWDTTTAPRLQDWLADRLAQDYPAMRAVHPAAARGLVEQGHVLPVLDGLDELPDRHRPTVLTALNSSLSAADPLILTCRTEEYSDAVGASDVLTAAAVIEPEPLRRSEAVDYLVTCLLPEPGDSWRKVLAALRAGDAPALAEVCTTPLGLWLVRMVYIAGRLDPVPLLDHAHATTLRAELLGQLIPAVIGARLPTRDPDDPLRPRRFWDPDDVRRWLSLLAHQLDGKRDLLWWHLARHTLSPWWIRLTFGLVFGLMGGLAAERTGQLGGGLVIGLATGLVLGLAGGLVSGLIGGLVLGLVSGLVGGLMSGQPGWLAVGLVSGLMGGLMGALVGGLTVGRRVHNQITESEPKYVNLKLRGRATLLARQLAFGLMGGLVIGLVGGLVVGLLVKLLFGLLFGRSYGLAFVLAFGLVFGLAIGLAIGLTIGLGEWMETPTTADRAGTPLTTHRSDRASTVIQTMLIGLLFVLVIGLVGGLVVGLAIGLSGLAKGGSRAWLYYALAARWLAVTGRLPWRLMGFLDDAYRLGLLRIVGSAYQFRHADLQDHLAGSRWVCKRGAGAA